MLDDVIEVIKVLEHWEGLSSWSSRVDENNASLFISANMLVKRSGICFTWPVAVKISKGIIDVESIALMRRMVLVTGDWSIAEPNMPRETFASSIWEYSFTAVPL